MRFLLSILSFIALTIIVMFLAGGLPLFLDLPSIIFVIPTAIILGLASSKGDFIFFLKIPFSHQPRKEKSKIRQASIFYRNTGTIAVLLGVLATIIGFTAVSFHLGNSLLSNFIGTAIATSFLPIIYGILMKILFFSIEQKILNNHLSEQNV